MFGELDYDERKLARRRFRRQLDNFVRKGEELANANADLKVLIIIHSKELNQIVDFCNCSAPDLISQYILSKEIDLDEDFLARISKPSKNSFKQLPSEKHRRQPGASLDQLSKKSKLSSSQLSSTRADTEKLEDRSRSPTYRPHSPISQRFAYNFGQPNFELLESKGPPIVKTSALPCCSSGYSPPKVHETSLECQRHDTTFIRSPSDRQSPGSFDEDIWDSKGDNLFDMMIP